MGCSEVAIKYFSSVSLSPTFSLPLPMTLIFLAIHITFLTTLLQNYLVQLIVKLGKLSNLLHHFFTHEKWSAKRGVALDG
jgi:hypothetical protein